MNILQTFTSAIWYVAEFTFDIGIRSEAPRSCVVKNDVWISTVVVNITDGCDTNVGKEFDIDVWIHVR